MYLRGFLLTAAFLSPTELTTARPNATLGLGDDPAAAAAPGPKRLAGLFAAAASARGLAFAAAAAGAGDITSSGSSL